MRRIVLNVLMPILVVMLLAGCANEEFTCGLCMQQVNGKAHAVTFLGQEAKICDQCFKVLK